MSCATSLFVRRINESLAISSIFPYAAPTRARVRGPYTYIAVTISRQPLCVKLQMLTTVRNKARQLCTGFCTQSRSMPLSPSPSPLSFPTPGFSFSQVFLPGSLLIPATLKSTHWVALWQCFKSFQSSPRTMHAQQARPLSRFWLWSTKIFWEEIGKIWFTKELEHGQARIHFHENKKMHI